MNETNTNRRHFLKLTAATGAAVGLASTVGRAGAQAAASPAKPGDLLIYQDGAKKGQPVKLADIKLDANVSVDYVRDGDKRTAQHIVILQDE